MVEVYNSLPSLWDADTRFTNRETIFAAAAPLLSRYNFEWGLCLIHAHCKLDEGEIMLGRGNVSQPEKESEIVEQVFAERWLANGQPYEFTTRPTKTPPSDLMKDFGKIVGTDGILGLYHVENKDGGGGGGSGGDDYEINGATPVKPDEKLVEVTEGRKNVVLPMPDSELSEDVEQKGTAWDFGKIDPQTRGCAAVLHCLVNYRGGHAVHTGQRIDMHITRSPNVKLEYTEGRKNICIPYPDSSEGAGDSGFSSDNQIDTAWDFAQGPEPVSFRCVVMMICDWGYDAYGRLYHTRQKIPKHYNRGRAYGKRAVGVTHATMAGDFKG